MTKKKLRNVNGINIKQNKWKRNGVDVSKKWGCVVSSWQKKTLTQPLIQEYTTLNAWCTSWYISKSFIYVSDLCMNIKLVLLRICPLLYNMVLLLHKKLLWGRFVWFYSKFENGKRKVTLLKSSHMNYNIKFIMKMFCSFVGCFSDHKMVKPMNHNQWQFVSMEVEHMASLCSMLVRLWLSSQSQKPIWQSFSWPMLSTLKNSIWNDN